LPSESDTNVNNLNSGDLLVDCNSSEVDREIDISLNNTNNLKYQHADKYKISDNGIEETLNDEVIVKRNTNFYIKHSERWK
jgi:hypothetical protein